MYGRFVKFRVHKVGVKYMYFIDPIQPNESLDACKITVVAIKRLKRVFPFVLLSPMPFAINRVLSPPISAR